MPRVLLSAALLAVAATLTLPGPALAFTDVPTSHWAHDQITYVAQANPWMQDFGPDEFRPDALETRSLLAAALVRAYAPDEAVDPEITFPDLPATDPAYPYANVAVKLGWIRRTRGGAWSGEDPVRRTVFDRALVRAMGLQGAAAGIAALHQADGTPYRVPRRTVPYLQLAAWLRLHHDWDDEARDLQPRSLMPRDEVAHALWRAKTTPSWKLDAAARFETMELPTLDPSRTRQRVLRDLTQFAIDQVGYPYIWAGEWNRRSPSGYCCGFQPQGGFDCSGFVWWVVKRAEGGYDAARYRDYGGWSLPERSSSAMARMAPTRLRYRDLRPGHLMFFASNGGGSYRDVDHVGIYLGSGWMVHSTSGGVQLEWVADGWYRDHFAFGRSPWERPTASAARAPLTSAPWPEALGGDRAATP